MSDVTNDVPQTDPQVISKADLANKDSVPIGSKVFQINRDLAWSDLYDMALEADQLDRERKNPTSTPLEHTSRQYKWTLNVFKTCLIDFDESVIRTEKLKREYINTVAAQIFWACQYNLSFLEMASVSSSLPDVKTK